MLSEERRNQHTSDRKTPKSATWPKRCHRTVIVFNFSAYFVVIMMNSLFVSAIFFVFHCVGATIEIQFDGEHSHGFLTRNQYLDIAENTKHIYSEAAAFPHISFDNMFPKDLVHQASLEFPQHHLQEHLTDGWGVWKSTSKEQNLKYFLRDEEKMGEATQKLITHLRSGMFISFLERLTGIQYLVSDPAMHGGGLHQIATGGHLSIHADFNRRETDGLFRRVNVFIFLNENWSESYGGDLELWDSNVTKCEEKIAPILGRLAIFSSSRLSFHGHPDPLNTPIGVYRKSIALYYYTVSPGPNDHIDDAYVTTDFRDRPNGLDDFKYNLEF